MRLRLARPRPQASPDVLKYTAVLGRGDPMQLKMLNKGKARARIELVGETHTFADLLRRELVEDTKRVKSAAYDKHHPQLGNPILILETDGEDPTTTVKRAAKNIAEKCKELRLEVEKAAKRS